MKADSDEIPAVPIRPSDAERDRAIELLSEGAAGGRLSHETFLSRMERALAARGRDELAALTADLAGPPAGWAVRAAGVPAAFTRRMVRLCGSARLPRLLLPEPGPLPLRVGRQPGCGLRLADAGVSRAHAELRAHRGGWLLRDLGSMNGTWVNGVRVVGEVPVRAGDTVRFGSVGYRLARR